MLDELGPASQAQLGRADFRLVPWLHRQVAGAEDRVVRSLRLTDRYRFDDRRRLNSVLVCLLIGHHRELWPFTLPRIAAAVTDQQVCLVTAGLFNPALSDYCRANNWSYLSTATSDPSLAQNVCYRLHPGAELIVKIEDDVFIDASTLDALTHRFRAIRAVGELNPGLLAPLVPLEAFACRYLLQTFGLLEQFQSHFGLLPWANSSSPLWNNPQATRWLWQEIAPLATTAARLAAGGEKLLVAPFFYRPGLAVFERSFWASIGYFPSSRRRLMLGGTSRGADDFHMCTQSALHERPIVIAADLLATRFSFPHHYSTLKSLLAEQPDWFRS